MIVLPAAGDKHEKQQHFIHTQVVDVNVITAAFTGMKMVHLNKNSVCM
jgi:hypothetical protein